MSAAQVLAIPELLELILVNTDAIQLFNLRRVNTFFLDLIDSSSAIRKRMCLQLDNDDHYEDLDHIVERLNAHAVTGPFKILPRSQLLNGIGLFDLEVDCNFLRQTLGSGLKFEPVFDGSNMMQTSGPWQSIKVGNSQHDAEVVVSCPCIDHLDEMPLARDSTLGDLMNLGKDMLRNHWHIDHFTLCYKKEDYVREVIVVDD